MRRNGVQRTNLGHSQPGYSGIEIFDGKHEFVSPGSKDLPRRGRPGLHKSKPVPLESTGSRRLPIVVLVDGGDDGQGTFDAVGLRKPNEYLVEGWAQARLDQIMAGGTGIRRIRLVRSRLETLFA